MDGLSTKPWLSWIGKPRLMLAVYILFAIVASLQSYFSPPRALHEDGPEYTRYNNYVIFRNSFEHLLNNEDLYTWYDDEQWDLYKYSPSFAAFFGLFALLPDLVGLSLWNLLNALVLLLGFYSLPGLSRFEKGLATLFCAIEMLTSIQVEQSNALIAGLILLAFAGLERQKWSLAALCIVFSVYIKIFGFVAFALFLFYYRHWWKLALYTLLWTVLIGLLPLLFTGLDDYAVQMQNWGRMLSEDHAASYGLSVMGWLYTWFALEPDKLLVVLTGALLFCLPLLRLKSWNQANFRQDVLASVLLWIVIFNHKAESPTFVIACSGVILWYLGSSRNGFHTALLVLCLLLTVLSPTDLFPAAIRREWVVPFVLKAVPCIVIWLVLILEMGFGKKQLVTGN